jgi:hypothetical protein
MTTAQEIYDLVSADIFKQGVLQRIDFGSGLRTLQKSIEVVEKIGGLTGLEKKNLVLDVLDIALKNHVGTGKAVRIIADVAPTLIDQLVLAYNSELFQKLQKKGCKGLCLN